MSIKATELDIETQLISKAGSKISAGQTRPTTKRTTSVAQFPAERSAGNDNSQDLRVTDLYRNGLLFTAYDYSARTTGSMRDFRGRQLDAMVKNPNAIYSTTSQIPVANILLPRSKSDVDNISHRFNDVGESLIAKGGGTATGVLSNMASTAVFGALESMTQGLMADSGEQIHTTARSMYGGADNRQKVFTWDLTPRSLEDLIQIIAIYEMFAYYSYGTVGTSDFAKDIKAKLDSAYKESILKPMTPDDAVLDNTMFEKVTNFLSNVIVVSNPTVWFVRNFGKTSSFDARPDLFGPAQISSIRFDKSPNGNFNGLAVAPNLPSSFVLEVTFREILTIDRSSLFGKGANT